MMYRQKKKNFHIKGKKDKKSEKMKIGSDLQKIGGKGTEKWKTPTGKVMTIPVDSPTPGGMISGKKNGAMVGKFPRTRPRHGKDRDGFKKRRDDP